MVAYCHSLCCQCRHWFFHEKEVEKASRSKREKEGRRKIIISTHLYTNRHYTEQNGMQDTPTVMMVNDG